jgi:hypothetical protein
VRSAASSISQRWSISKLVLKVAFSSSEGSRGAGRAALLEDRVPDASLFFAFSISSFSRCGLRIEKLPDSVLCV